MNQSEIVRRLRALLALSPEKRPISVDRLEYVAGVADNEVYRICRSGAMQRRTEQRLAHALKLVENDQVVVKRGNGVVFGGRPPEVTVREPQPPQLMVRRIVFTENGPRIKFEAVNPRAFPQFDAPTVKAVKRRPWR